MGTRGEIIIPLDAKGTVHSYYVNWAHPSDIMHVLETMTEKSFVKHAGDGAIRSLGIKRLLPQTNKRVNMDDREVGRNRKVAHYLTNKGTVERMPPAKLNLVKIAAGEARPPEDILDNSVYYIFDGSKWIYIWDRDVTKDAPKDPPAGDPWFALDADGNRLPGNRANERSEGWKSWKAISGGMVAAALLKVIHKRFGSGVTESADAMRRRMRMQSIAEAEGADSSALPANIQKTIDRFNLAASNRGLDLKVDVVQYEDYRRRTDNNGWKYATFTSKKDGSGRKRAWGSSNAKETIIDIKRVAYDAGMLSSDREDGVILLNESMSEQGHGDGGKFGYGFCKHCKDSLQYRPAVNSMGPYFCGSCGEFYEKDGSQKSVLTRDFVLQQAARFEKESSGWGVLDWKETNGRMHDFSLFGGAGGRIPLGSITSKEDLAKAVGDHLEESAAGFGRGRRPLRESIDMSNLMSITRDATDKAVENIIRRGGSEDIDNITDLESAAYAGASVAVAQCKEDGDVTGDDYFPLSSKAWNGCRSAAHYSANEFANGYDDGVAGEDDGTGANKGGNFRAARAAYLAGARKGYAVRG